MGYPCIWHLLVDLSFSRAFNSLGTFLVLRCIGSFSPLWFICFGCKIKRGRFSKKSYFLVLTSGIKPEISKIAVELGEVYEEYEVHYGITVMFLFIYNVYLESNKRYRQRLEHLWCYRLEAIRVFILIRNLFCYCMYNATLY